LGAGGGGQDTRALGRSHWYVLSDVGKDSHAPVTQMTLDFTCALEIERIRDQQHSLETEAIDFEADLTAPTDAEDNPSW
jgi:hypothetical protein